MATFNVENPLRATHASDIIPNKAEKDASPPLPSSRRASVTFTGVKVRREELDGVFGDHIFSPPSESIFGMFFAIVAIKADFTTALEIQTRRAPGVIDTAHSNYTSVIIQMSLACLLVLAVQGSLAWFIWNDLQPLKGDPNFCNGSIALQIVALVSFYILLCQSFIPFFARDLVFYRAITKEKSSYVIVSDTSQQSELLEVRERCADPNHRLQVAFAALVLYGELLVCTGVCLTGARFLVQQPTGASTVQSAVALIFILQFDDAVYEMFFPKSVKDSLLRVRICRQCENKKCFEEYQGGYLTASLIFSHSKFSKAKRKKLESGQWPWRLNSTLQEIVNRMVYSFIVICGALICYLYQVRLMSCVFVPDALPTSIGNSSHISIPRNG